MFEPEELMARIVDLEEQLKVSEMAPPAAEQLIACLEGEIAKRDARIDELESRYQRDVWGLNNEGDPIGGEPAGGYANDNARLRAELAAIKAQEPVAAVKRGPLDSDGWPEFVRVETIGDFDLENLPNGMKLYAAPVSEAKAQGVEQVQWQVRYLKAETVSDGWWQDSSEQRAAWCAAANQQQHAKGLPDTWEIRRLNAATVQQVSVPDVSAMARILADRNADACNVNREDNWMIYGQDYIDDVTAILAAAPAAPAADAGIVDMYRHLQKVTPYRFKKIQDASITDGGDVMYFHKDRFDAALLADMAAHSAKGVV